MVCWKRTAPLGVVGGGLVALLAARKSYACDYTVEAKASLRFNIETDRLYVEGGGCMTPSDIYQAKLTPVSDTDGNSMTQEEAELIPIKPLTKGGGPSVNETGYWIFTSDVYIYDGVKLELHADSGTTAMRLRSDAEKIIELRAHGGWLSLQNTELSSWDEAAANYVDYDPNNSSFPRSYVTAISEMLEPGQTCNGTAQNDAGEARFDIINSEVHHLGYHASESYGISWKVRGFCTDLSNEDLFDRVNVRGDIRFSDIHNNWFGMYSYGHQDGLWEYNLMHDNAAYGFDPHDDSDNLRIHNNVVWNNGDHGIIASKRCNDVSIQNNIVYNNNNSGIMLHRSSDHAIVRNNTITGNADACVAIFESMEGDYSNNRCEDNLYGFRWSVGASNNKIYDNEIYRSTQYGIYMYKGSDPYEVLEYEGLPSYNIIANNIIDTAAEGIKIGDTVGNEFSGNVITNTVALRFANSTDIIWQDNEVPALVEFNTDNACFTAESDFAQLGDEVIACS